MAAEDSTTQAILDDEQLRTALTRLGEAKRAAHSDDYTGTIPGTPTTELHPGEILFRQGERVQRLYVLLSGAVEVVHADDGSREFDDAEIDGLAVPQTTEATAGVVLGLYELAARQPHATTARVRSTARALVIDADQAYRVFYADPHLQGTVAPLTLKSRLRTIPLLSGVDSATISLLADHFQIRTYDAGANIYQAGENATTLYLIDRGQVLLEHVDGRRLWLGNGAEFGFGERAALSAGSVYDLDHNATAVCATTVFGIPIQTFLSLTKIVCESNGAALRKARADAVAATGVFKTLADEERAHLLGFMSHIWAPHRHLLAQQGEVADSLWILLDGQQANLSAVGGNGEALPSTRVTGPAYFNLETLFEQTRATSTLEAAAGSSWLRLHWTDYRTWLERTGRGDVANRLTLAQSNLQPATIVHKQYPWQQDGERIIQESRRHWVAAMSRLIPGLFTMIVAGWLTYAAFVMDWSEGDATPAWFAFFVGVMWVVTALFYAWGIIDYRNDFLIVTDLRVVHQEKVFLLRENRHIAPLEQVQDVNLGRLFWANLLGYANILVQTAGSAGSIDFDRCAQFEEIATAIRQHAIERKRHFGATGRAEIQRALERRLGKEFVAPSRVWVRPAAGSAAVGAGAAAPDYSRTRLFRWYDRISGRGPETSHELSSGKTKDPSKKRYVWHKHWLVLFRSLFIPLLVFGIAGAIGAGAWITLFNQAVARNGLITVSVFVGFIALFFIWYQWENWRNDIFILESDTLIDIERKPLAMQSDERRAPLSQIVDLRLRVPTPIHYLFNFGTVLAQTAATGSVFTFRNVPNPGAVMEIIRNRMDENRHGEERAKSMQRAQEFPEWLEAFGRIASDVESTEP